MSDTKEIFNSTLTELKSATLGVKSQYDTHPTAPQPHKVTNVVHHIKNIRPEHI